MTPPANTAQGPNFLMIMVDQLRYPRLGYGTAGFVDPIKDILSFVGNIDGNPYARHFPGFCKLREHAVVLTDHTIAESACVPSRASIMTGQYGPRSGVTQTDGLFKSGDAQAFPWLKADGTPTIGDWFRQLGYSTHYFGKWHVSDPPEHTLEGFGFADWELSWPEPHGALINNLGSFRDYQFAELACTFLRARGLGVAYDRAMATEAKRHPDSGDQPTPPPFFAVCSFTNPHDIAAYPTLPRQLAAGQDPDAGPLQTLGESFGPGRSVPIPRQGVSSCTPVQGSFRVPLNPTGLPQHCATASPSQDEDLLANNKPSAQYDYAYKVGLGLAAKFGLAAAQSALGQDARPAALLEAAVAATLQVAVPFQLQDDPDGAAQGFLQYYAYMISMVDRHILRVLEALEESGLRDNTILIFASDHGEYGAAHSMMIEKWHGAYQEAVHVPVLFSSAKLNGGDSPRVVTAQTSHIDLLPTLLGLAGCDADQRDLIRRQLSMTHPAAPLPGADLTPIIAAGGAGPVIGPDGRERLGVLFVTDDMITEPLPRDDDPHNSSGWQQFEVFCETVKRLRGEPGKHAHHPYLPNLRPGPVSQPCHVRALRSGPWKLVRYCDPWSVDPVPDQWELYQLEADPTEQCNLVVHDAPFPTVIAADQFPERLHQTPDELARIAQMLLLELTRQEAELLTPYPSAYPTAGAIAGL
ncbi:MAG: sulfatase-like hydrolase/transferase [Candidatus Accumulibacter sp.]|uniref:sulfatase-like hydrolase/transferase n=1 Tax=Accumulibacter sp. TaxID=2053492 RepID=UPI0025E58DDD|nr:sulfatase-like hydrolase/transferase [Accumulibacter sp.]MCP5247378.1 sulfatase-like hydrolase/transferase [Accumulibacter sp.]